MDVKLGISHGHEGARPLDLETRGNLLTIQQTLAIGKQEAGRSWIEKSLFLLSSRE